MAGLIYYARHSRNQRIVGVAPQSTIVPALENDIKALPMKRGRLRLDLQPFEIVTLKFARG